MDEWLVQPSSPSLSFPLLPSPFLSFLLLSSRLLSSAISVSPYSPRVAVQHEVNINSSAKHPRFIWLLQFPGCEKVGMCDATSECFSVPQMFFNQAKLLLYCFVDVIVISTFALPSVVIQSLMWSVLYHVCVTVWALPESDATVHLSGWFITNPSSTVLCGLSGSLLPFTVRYMNGVLSLYEWLSECHSWCFDAAQSGNTISVSLGIHIYLQQPVNQFAMQQIWIIYTELLRLNWFMSADEMFIWNVPGAALRHRSSVCKQKELIDYLSLLYTGRTKWFSGSLILSSILSLCVY